MIEMSQMSLDDEDVMKEEDWEDDDWDDNDDSW